MLVCLHAHVLNIIYTDINQQSTDQQRNMPTQYYSSLKSFITFFYKTNEEMTAAQKVENDRMSLVLKYCETNYLRIGRGEDLNGRMRSPRTSTYTVNTYTTFVKSSCISQGRTRSR